MMEELIRRNFEENRNIMNSIYRDYPTKITEISRVIINAYMKNNKLLLAGNGGSSADAHHIAGELVNKFYHNRKALSAICLSADDVVLTSWANDVSYDTIFSRQIEAHGNSGDIFMPITTSGNSKNLIYAAEEAKKRGLITIGLLGNNGGLLKKFCDYDITVPSKNTPRVQEVHMLVYHSICQLVEEAFLL